MDLTGIPIMFADDPQVYFVADALDIPWMWNDADHGAALMNQCIQMKPILFPSCPECGDPMFRIGPAYGTDGYMFFRGGWSCISQNHENGIFVEMD